jgi:hypothetical protein
VETATKLISKQTSQLAAARQQLIHRFKYADCKWPCVQPASINQRGNNPQTQAVPIQLFKSLTLRSKEIGAKQDFVTVLGAEKGKNCATVFCEWFCWFGKMKFVVEEELGRFLRFL